MIEWWIMLNPLPANVENMVSSE